MIITKLSNNIDIKKYLSLLNVSDGGQNILQNKMQCHLFYIQDLKVEAVNILKQDALSIGADLAVPMGVISASKPLYDCILMGTSKHIKILSKKEKAQPFGLKNLADQLALFLTIKKKNKTSIMGVINANEDSFFKDSRFNDKEVLVQIEKMIKDGADIIDLGAVSSRPKSIKVDDQTEFKRLKNIIDMLYKNKIYEKTTLSLDSYSPLSIKYALDNGFKIINDITGLENQKVIDLIAKYKATAIIMHMQNNPKNMQDNPQYNNILDDITQFFKQRILKAKEGGIKNIILDVGIGFGKNLDHNLTLIKNLEHFKHLGFPILLGVSRKSLIDQISPSLPEDRLSGTLTLNLEGVRNGADILRVHDVYEHNQALKVEEKLKYI